MQSWATNASMKRSDRSNKRTFLETPVTGPRWEQDGRSGGCQGKEEAEDYDSMEGRLTSDLLPTAHPDTYLAIKYGNVLSR
ncbi:hypothetical protein J6590_099513, partial [Homalodisca vitripennis]